MFDWIHFFKKTRVQKLKWLNMMRELSPPATYVASSRGEQKDKNEDEAGRLLVLYSAAVLCPVRAQVEDNHTSVDTHL